MNKTLGLACAALLAAAACAPHSASAAMVEKAGRFGGLQVQYRVLTPPGYDPAKAYPTILVFTGGGQAFAQTASQPAPAIKPIAPVTAPAAKPAAQPSAAQAKKININTATAAELDTLKGIGEARAKKIIEERGKAKFKDFADLVKRGTLPANVEAEIKDKITF